MNYQQIISDLQKKIYKPIYFLDGEEPYFIDKISQYIQDHVLNESEKSFNQTILYGKDTTAETIISAARRFPMMGNNQVVIVKEAQNLKDFNNLEPYIDKPQKSTILVICYKYKKLDKRTRLYKKLNIKNNTGTVYFTSAKIPEYKIPEWIGKYMESKGKKVTPEASMLITEYLGNDLNKVSHELNKLLISLPEDVKTITPKDIEKNIGISKDYNPFELNNALAEKNVVKANRIIQHFGKNPNETPMPMVIGSLYYFFSKLLGYHLIDKSDQRNVQAKLKIYRGMNNMLKKASKKYSIKKTAVIIGYLREYDLKSKGLNNVGANDEELMKEMIFKILH
jgi:DNA polymerase-3 subunit delta